MTTPNNAITYKDRAFAAIKHGLNVIPLRPESKIAVEKDWPSKSSNSLADVERDNATNPNYNCGIVFKALPDGQWALETDSSELARRYKAETGKKIPSTLTNQSRVGRGHRIYKNTPASISMGNIAQEDAKGFSVRCHNQYIVSPLSVHPETKTLYETVIDTPIVEAPDDFVAWLVGQKKTKTVSEKSTTWLDEPISTGGRNSTLTAIGGALRRVGLDEDAIYAVLSIKNQNQCAISLSDEEIRTIAGSVSRYEPEKTSLYVGGIPKDGPDAIAAEAAALQKSADDISKWKDNFKTVNELEEGEVRMLINGFLPEGTTFIGALPGEGKTLLALSIVKALTTGEDFLGQFDVPGITPVIYMTPESGGRAFRKRCEKFRIPNDRDVFLCRTISEGATLPLDDPTLMEAVRVMKPVVILDTLIRFSESNDENAAMQNKQMVDDVIKLRQMGAIGVIGLHHSTKAMREKGMSLETVLRGTGDLAACADAVYGMLRDAALYDHGLGPNEIDVECVKPRDFDPPLPFRIAASRKTNTTTIGRAPGIESVIDANGEFLFVQRAELQVNRDAELVRLVKEDPSITLQEMEKSTGLGTWIIRRSLKRLGWTKQKGGAKGTSQWARKIEPGNDGVPTTISQPNRDADVALDSCL